MSSAADRFGCSSSSRTRIGAGMEDELDDETVERCSGRRAAVVDVELVARCEPLVVADREIISDLRGETAESVDVA